MDSENDDRSRLADLLNTSTPFAPTSAEDINERLATRKAQASAAPEIEDAAQDDRADEEEGPLFPDLGGPGPGGGPAPASQPPAHALSALAGLTDLIAEINSFGSSLEAAMRPASEHTGDDSTGTVSVTLAADGLPDRLAFRRPWKRALTVATFDQAVLEALSNAWTARISVSVSGLNVAGAAPGPPKTPPKPAPVPGRPLGINPDTALRQVNLLAAEFSEALSKIEGEIDRPVSDEERATIVRSANHRVSLTIVGDAVTEVATQDNWLRNADESRIATEFENAFTAAREAVQTRSDFEPASTPAIARLEFIAQEAQDLTRGIFHIPGEGER